MVMTGPYTTGAKAIKLWDGAHGVELYIGKFSKDFRSMDGWLKLTNSKTGELLCVDCWRRAQIERVQRLSRRSKGGKLELSPNDQIGFGPELPERVARQHRRTALSMA